MARGKARADRMIPHPLDLSGPGWAALRCMLEEVVAGMAEVLEDADDVATSEAREGEGTVRLEDIP